MTRTNLVVLSSLVCLVATGCTSVATTGEVRAQLSPGSVLITVPSIPEEGKGSCGLDCMTSLLRMNGLDLDDEGRRRFPLADVAKEWISAGEMRDYLILRGFRAVLVQGTLDHARPAGLLRLLEAGLPVIVERDIEGSNHFQLVCGFDVERHCLFVMLPMGVGAVPYDKFEKSWAATEHLALVATPEAKLAATPAGGG
jgi:ABC-type bacteriocin/lantibiotic exporter with double-glycine peptidase domain